MNHSRWIFVCPRCKTALEANERGVVCGICYPNIRARALQPIEGGLFRQVPDDELVAEARTQAEDKGEHYAMKFPTEREQIETILRLRSGIHHMNWNIGESMEDLIEQNREHGDPIPKGVK